MEKLALLDTIKTQSPLVLYRGSCPAAAFCNTDSYILCMVQIHLQLPSDIESPVSAADIVTPIPTT